MIYDVIIIGAGAAGLFSGFNLPKNLKKIILEKNKTPGAKILLSGGERANVSNINIDVSRDYFGQNKKALISVFNKYNQFNIQSFFAENLIDLIEEDRGRLILKSGNSRDLLNLFLEKVRENNCEIITNSDVKKIVKNNNIFEIKLENNEKFKSRNIIVSTGGKSFFQVGTTGEGYNFAENFGIKIITPIRALVGLTTKENLDSISGISCNLKLELLDKIKTKNKVIYEEFGPILFTHFGLSGPIVFNISTALGEYLNKINLKEKEIEKYILENIEIKIDFNNIENIPKRIKNFFKLEYNIGDLTYDNFVKLGLQNFRSWKEAKVTGGGISLDELDKNFMVKKVPGLYFIGEVLDIVGKTGGFNLQWAFSSAYVCSSSFKITN